MKVMKIINCHSPAIMFQHAKYSYCRFQLINYIRWINLLITGFAGHCNVRLLIWFYNEMGTTNILCLARMAFYCFKFNKYLP